MKGTYPEDQNGSCAEGIELQGKTAEEKKSKKRLTKRVQTSRIDKVASKTGRRTEP